ncbi:MAG: PaaI family thioesterase [Candidatus Krumholzibacteriia bacterium]|nr:PaaI family thioesterase [bacterium]MCB9516442.1 PaaI family thioesterase [Candidatus Latescibacterota bacterium]
MSDAFQDYYPDDFARCYGCGKDNPKGYQLKTRWTDEAAGETVTAFTPRPEHTAIPGFVYGGVIASVIDCSGTGTAAAAAYRAVGRKIGEGEAFRFVTGRLTVNYLKPTPLGPELTIRCRIEEVKGRKVTVSAELSAEGVVTATGEVVAVQIPDDFGR